MRCIVLHSDKKFRCPVLLLLFSFIYCNRYRIQDLTISIKEIKIISCILFIFIFKIFVDHKCTILFLGTQRTISMELYQQESGGSLLLSPISTAAADDDGGKC